MFLYMLAAVIAPDPSASRHAVDARAEYHRVVKATWDYRLALTEGRVVVETTLARQSMGEQREDKFRRDVTFSPNSLREDYWVQSTSSRPQGSEVRHIRCFGCEGDKRLRYAEGVSYVQLFSNNDKYDTLRLEQAFDPRFFGLLIEDTANINKKVNDETPTLPIRLEENVSCRTDRVMIEGKEPFYAILDGHINKAARLEPISQVG